MIKWLSTDDLRRHLDAASSIGLWLRGWFHATTSSDLRTTMPVPPEAVFDEGLGPVDVWCGLADDQPFAVRCMATPRGMFGMELLLPVPRTERDARIEVLQQLLPLLPLWEQPYFDQLPIGAGFGVVPNGASAPIFTSESRRQAEAITALLGPSYRVLELPPQGPRRWLVVGPAAGPYASRVEVASSALEATQLAARWADQTGALFDVRMV